MNESAEQATNSILSICIPTFNRGRKAINLVKSILSDHEFNSSLQILVLNNASNQEIECYDEIEALSKSHQNLTYFRHDENRMMHGNYLACFQYAITPYIMIISDEDFPNLTTIHSVLPLLLQHTNVGIMRGSIQPKEGSPPRNSINYPNKSFFAGQEALLGFSLSNNYFSGTIYHRKQILELGLINRLSSNLQKNAAYPHLYLELLVCAVCDVVTTSEVCCLEGAPQIIEGNQPNNYAIPYSFGSRVDQFIVLRDGYREAVSLVNQKFDVALFVNLYLLLCEKYFYLISRVNSPMYASNLIHPGLLHQSMLYICGAAISMYPEIQGCDTEIFTEIQRIHARYELFSQGNGDSA